MTDTTSITYPTAEVAAEAMDAMPIGAAVVVGEEMFVKEEPYGMWIGVDWESDAEEVAALGTVERIDHMPGVREWLDEMQQEKDEAEAQRRAESDEWREFLKTENRHDDIETW
ncbi:hypothetical protein FRC0549_00089 [Corynebacterium diphtheriae]|nr:hypothetical protein FRC0549_00089 [Corynebacterium diphtheriae]